MGLLEYLLEHRNPGRIGSVDVEPPEPSGSYLVLRGLIAAASIAAWTWFLWSQSHNRTGPAACRGRLACLSVYCVLAAALA